MVIDVSTAWVEVHCVCCGGWCWWPGDTRRRSPRDNRQGPCCARCLAECRPGMHCCRNLPAEPAPADLVSAGAGAGEKGAGGGY